MQKVLRFKLLSLLGIFFLLSASQAFAQGSVSGTVTDAETGEELIGVNVVLPSLNIGDATGSDGTYLLTDVPEGEYRIEARYVGFETVRRTITVEDGQETIVNFEMSAAVDELGEVIVTAFGVERESRSIGYSIQDVSAEDIGRAGSDNLLGALQGQVSGVQINQGGGGAGQGMQIFIRGFNSLDPTADNQPLFVVDGVPIDNSTTEASIGVRGMSNRAMDLSPNDIESISVLKSAPATALYGVRAANGAVIITTKKGEAGDIQVDFAHSISREDVINQPDYQDVYGPGFGFSSAPDGFWPAWGAPYSETPELTYYNNWENSMRTGIGINNSVSVSGGTENVTFYTSISNSNNRGILPNNDWDRTSIRVSGELFQGPLTVAASANYINSGGSRVPFINFMARLAYWNTSADVTDWRHEDGTMKSDSRDGRGSGRNPIYDAEINTYEDDVNRLIGNLRTSYEFADWLSLEYMLGIDTYSDERTDIEPGPRGLENEFVWSNVGGYRQEGRISSTDLSSNLAANINLDLTQDIGMSLRVGNDIFDRSSNTVRARGERFSASEFNHFSNAANISIYQRLSQRRLIGLYGDLNLDWNDVLYLNVTGRNDWTSTLPKDERSFFYPSVNLGYVFSDMIELPNWMTYGKFRASYAEVGKDAPPYSTQDVYVAPSIFPLDSQIGFTKGATINSSDLKPERTTSSELGFDLRFLNNRLGFDFTWYKANSKDMIIPVPVSNATGSSQFITNAGEIENRGIELSVRATPVETRDFQWNINSNFTRNRNEVVAIRDGVDAIFLGQISAYINNPFMQLIPGESYGAIWGTHYARYGADPESNTIDTSLPIIIGDDGFPVVESDPKIVGDATPDWTANLFNQFNYKSWDFSFNIDIVYGVDKYNKLDNWDAAFGHTTKTLNREDYVVFDGVLEDGSPNTQEVWLGQGVDPETGRNYGAGYHRNTYRVAVEESTEDASYVKLRSVALGYTLPQSVLENIPFTNIRAGVNANNILLWTPFSQYDPEAFVSSGSNLVGLVDLAYPGTRSLTFSLNFSF
ncbi:SusC/RagA family TonB-linked outer membrane protein [Rhodohalobacter barkolensis]|uniref:SusC/RagA family TonB-linked outer membrane protein n=1 Tax=Rhodohalobacter barkolensis TaxID=2053187 RepID=A0A2N0VH24_9BACT|nr:SusC/RagA family TonB-linked outer membrane protein [Rhodohalobacter barkolensis]PKD43497.1 SusC/RagA family TonB-linked outer membrane protein [Rhodohalobacter barkolensis]